MGSETFLSLAWGGLIASIFGALMCFFGYRLFLFLLPIWGFFFGLSLGAQSMQALFGTGFLASVTSWVVGFVIGLIFALLSYLFYMAAVAIIGGSLGYMVVVGILLAIGMPMGFLVWLIGLPEGSFISIKLTELFIVPMVLLLIRCVASYRFSHKGLIGLITAFVLWCSLAMLLNGQDFDFSLFVRLSGSLFGLIFGLTLIKDKEIFNRIILLIFISTLIPVLAILVQIISNYFGMPFLFYTSDTTRELRFAGLFFDTGTTGRVNIISLITCSYLIVSDTFSRKTTNLLLVFMALTLLVNIVGGTRSILITSLAIFILLLYIKFKQFRKWKILHSFYRFRFGNGFEIEVTPEGRYLMDTILGASTVSSSYCEIEVAGGVLLAVRPDFIPLSKGNEFGCFGTSRRMDGPEFHLGSITVSVKGIEESNKIHFLNPKEYSHF